MLGLKDDDRQVIFVDVIPHARRNQDPRPAIMHGLTELRDNEDVLLVRHVFDPIPLRDLFASRGFASLGGRRRPNDWYVYFYRPTAFAAAVAHVPGERGVPHVRAGRRCVAAWETFHSFNLQAALTRGSSLIRKLGRSFMETGNENAASYKVPTPRVANLWTEFAAQDA